MGPSEHVFAFANIRAYLANTNRPHEVAPDGNFVQVRYRDGSVAADIMMRPLASSAGKPWVAVSITLGSVDRYVIRAALVANDELPLGGLADYDGPMLLRQTLPLTSLTFAHLEQVWQVMTRTASAIVPTAALPVGARAEAPFGFLIR